jgi:hypothetical protein
MSTYLYFNLESELFYICQHICIHAPCRVYIGLVAIMLHYFEDIIRANILFVKLIFFLGANLWRPLYITMDLL